MEGVIVDQRIFNDLIELKLPEISQKFKQCNLDCSVFSIQWFVCIFCRTLDHRLFDVLIDNLVIEGSISLFKAGITVLKLLEKYILNAVDFRILKK